MNAAALAFLNIRARPMRNLLLTLIVALAIATALTLLVLAESIREGLRAGSDERGADLTVSQRDASDLLSGYVPLSLEPALAAVPGVAGVSGELVLFAPVDGSRQSIVLGWTSDAYFWKGIPLVAGRVPEAGDQRPAVLGAGIAATLQKSVGSTIDVFGEPFHVIGISGYASAMNRSVIVLRLSDLQELAMRNNQVTAFHLALRPDQTRDDIERIKRQIEALGRVVVSPTDQLLRNDRNYEFLQAISRAISVIAFAMGSLSVGSALLMAVNERRREIGILMAIGWSDAKIRAAVVAEGLAIGLFGGAVAIPLVLLASLLFRHLPGIGEILAFRLTPGVAILGIVASILLCAIGSLYPAIRATRMNPSQVLRAA
jgi:putative ABC transport system permease protein